MSFTFAITGKGGAGKTTLAALFVANLLNSGKLPVLAVDADPNSCLDAALGLRIGNTIGRLREQARAESAERQGISKQELLEMQISESLIENMGFDFIAMGRPEGPGCYCYANNVLRNVLNAIAQSYPYVVIDNEAGLENLSRRLLNKTDIMLLVGDTSQSGIKTIKRIHALAGEMGIEHKRLGIIINRVSHENKYSNYEDLKSELAANFLLVLPDDGELHQFNEKGKSLLELPHNNPVNMALNEFIGRLDLPATPHP